MKLTIFIAVSICSFNLVSAAAPILDYLQCLECISHYTNGTENDNCPVHDFALPNMNPQVDCPYGGCYILLDKVKGVDIVYRGCSNNLRGLPYTLPDEGAYTWKGRDLYLCYLDSCNLIEAAKSKGKAVDAHLNLSAISEGKGGPVDCYQCSNYDEEGKHFKQCPKDEGIDFKGTVYLGECNKTCFTRTYVDNPERVARGCTVGQWGLPNPLPPDGCYEWNGVVWCICNNDRCNAKPMGKSSGVELDEHIAELLKDFKEEDGLNRCYECSSHDDKGNFYKQCAKDHRVKNAYVGICNGTCFSRSFDYDDKKIARGCTTTQYGLPDPLPPDGCYKWYSEVWCVCSSTRCNGAALGKPKDIEFDAHIQNPTDDGSGGAASRDHWSMTSFLFWLSFCCIQYFVGFE